MPLSEPLYRRLRAEAGRTGVPATRLAANALERRLDEAHREGVGEAVAAYEAAVARSVENLDLDLETAAVDHLLGTHMGEQVRT